MRRNLTLSRNCRVMAEKRSGGLSHVQTRSRSQHLAGSEISHFQTAKVRREKKDILFFRFLYFKVAECSFCSSSCWCHSANAQGLQKTKMPSIEGSFYLINTRTISALFLLIIERSIFIVFIFLLQGYDRKSCRQILKKIQWLDFLQINKTDTNGKCIFVYVAMATAHTSA